MLNIFLPDGEVCSPQERYGGVILYSQFNPINHHLLCSCHRFSTASAILESRLHCIKLRGDSPPNSSKNMCGTSTISSPCSVLWYLSSIMHHLIFKNLQFGDKSTRTTQIKIEIWMCTDCFAALLVSTDPEGEKNSLWMATFTSVEGSIPMECGWEKFVRMTNKLFAWEKKSHKDK